MLALVLGISIASTCVGPALHANAHVQPFSAGRRVLVIANASDPDSVSLAKYYADRRGIPKENVVVLKTKTQEEIESVAFAQEVQAPVRDALAKTKNPIDFLVLIRGVPLRVKEGGHSVDSLLMSSGLPIQKLAVGKETFDISSNPYFGKNEPFSHARYQIYLACRLDGYTPSDVRKLIDHAIAAKPSKGPFLFNKAKNRTAESYGKMQATLDRAADVLRTKGFTAVLADGSSFAGSVAPVAGYASWASNDSAFNEGVYRSLRFQAGAIAETFVSFGGRTFRPTKGGQSLVADLIAGGVTGVKGYVSEPYTVALAKPDILFDRYTSGYNLAESFYAASPATHWKDVVIGDPLCAPYKAK